MRGARRVPVVVVAAAMGGIRDKVMELASGYRGRAKNCFRIATRYVEKGLQYQYRDRRAVRPPRVLRRARGAAPRLGAGR